MLVRQKEGFAQVELIVEKLVDDWVVKLVERQSFPLWLSLIHRYPFTRFLFARFLRENYGKELYSIDIFQLLKRFKSRWNIEKHYNKMF